MKSNYKIAAAVVASFVLGAGTAGVLHAQAKLPAYVVGIIDVKDEQGYKTDFLPKAQQVIKEHGGKYIAGGFNKAIKLTGRDVPNRVVILQFESMDAVKTWYDKEAPFERSVGDKYASFNSLAVEGVEQK